MTTIQKIKDAIFSELGMGRNEVAERVGKTTRVIQGTLTELQCRDDIYTKKGKDGLVCYYPKVETGAITPRMVITQRWRFA